MYLSMHSGRIGGHLGEGEGWTWTEDGQRRTCASEGVWMARVDTVVYTPQSQYALGQRVRILACICEGWVGISECTSSKRGVDRWCELGVDREESVLAGGVYRRCGCGVWTRECTLPLLKSMTPLYASTGIYTCFSNIFKSNESFGVLSYCLC